MLTTFLIPCIFIRDLYNKRRYRHLKKRYSTSFHATTPNTRSNFDLSYVMPADKKKIKSHHLIYTYTCEYDNSKNMPIPA